MKFASLLITLIGILGVTSPSYPQTKVEMEWVRDIGSDSLNETVFSTTIDTKGNVIALARIWDGGSGPARDIFKVQKYDGAGQFLWQKEMKGAMEQGMLPGGLCVDSNDNIFFLLNTFNTSFYFDTILFNTPNWESTIFKLSTNGELVWTKQINRIVHGWATEDNTALLAIDRDNNLIFTGGSRSSDSTFKIDGVPYFQTPVYGAFFIAKFTNDGAVLWAKPIDQRSGEPAYSHYSEGDFVAIDGKNNIYVLGKFGSTFKHDELEIASEGPLDMFIAKVNAKGELMWVNRIGSNLKIHMDWPWGLALDEEDNAYAQAVVYEEVTITGWSGVSSGSADPEIFICKFDPTGKVIWDKRIEGLNYQRLGSTVNDCPMGLAFSGNDNSIICRSHLFSPATIDSTTLNIQSEAGTPAVWAYATDGTLKWAKVISIEEGYVQFNDVDVDNDGNIFLGGYTGKYWSFDKGPFPISIEDSVFSTFGGQDGILAKFSLNEFSNVASDAQSIPHLSVYPNPFSERTTIDLPDDIPLASFVQIFNAAGEKVMEVPIASKSLSLILDRQGMAAGSYYYKLVAGTSILAQGEFVIQ
jgi:hypothetical protein